MFDLATLHATVAAHGPVARVVIAAHDGSSPREVGAAMLVWASGQSGTIGGGALEHEATIRARAHLAETRPLLTREALGPKLGQCCGGAVTLLTEVFTETTLPEPDEGVFARPIDGRQMPLSVKRLAARARGEGVLPKPVLLQGWMVEPIARPDRHLWIWGAGHVGRALVNVLTPLPGVAITWIDIAADRFPYAIPANVTPRIEADPALAVADAPPDAEHLIVTFSHALDLELCHRLLSHGFAACGLIGSATKSARFRSRLASLGHGPASIARIACPIGDPALGKHPQAIAVGVAAAFLRNKTQHASRQENAG
ncbi:xanthine dehydrogenase accessory protein XdhC [Paragemmobacter ruber]|uniref:Xanthine dehydrogenase accessory protein XdhC n=1 Tax=Paragemmobacter ruber TaxID=1985673 RepID=A0ABW9Y345_9RHOB|nr:xanthine dehydrogenase accessory protein XdhC [Rhodobacter ruber]NBE06798.1 xanthine dehydrogenase accessory protein XdhC [Rhodobacter ruber]